MQSSKMLQSQRNLTQLDDRMCSSWNWQERIGKRLEIRGRADKSREIAQNVPIAKISNRSENEKMWKCENIRDWKKNSAFLVLVETTSCAGKMRAAQFLLLKILCFDTVSRRFNGIRYDEFIYLSMGIFSSCTEFYISFINLMN